MQNNKPKYMRGVLRDTEGKVVADVTFDKPPTSLGAALTELTNARKA